MENFQQKPYRDGLARDLKDLRTQKGGKEKAGIFLDLVESTERYKLAKEEHQKELKLTKDQENLEEKRINKIFELIKTHPNFNYLISANGSLFGINNENNKKDQYTYLFNKINNTMILKPNGDKYPELDFSENLHLDRLDPQPKSLMPFDFHFQFSNHRAEGKGYLDYIYRSKFNPSTNNKFTEEHRPGTHLSFGLSVLQSKSTLDACGDEKLEEYFKNPKTKEAREFFANLFVKCNKEFIPGYWNFFLKERQLYLARKSKK